MRLRTFGDYSRPSGRRRCRASGLRLVGACTALACVVLGLFAGSSRADVNDYQGTQLYLIGPASSVASGSYRLMTSSSTTGTPQGDTRPRVAASSCMTSSACGYFPFSPGVLASGSFPTAVTPTPTIPATCKGWIVDGSGGMAFPAGSWQFAVDVKVGVGGATGAASLVVGMWKVDNSGAPVAGGTLINPTAASSDMSINMIPFAGTTHLFSFATPPSVSAFTLAANEHLCVQVWRYQYQWATTGGNTGNTFSMLANDSNNVITHPTPDGFPIMTPSSSPGDGSYVNASQTLTLGATYSDPENEAGTVVTEVCQNSGCSPSFSSNTSSSVASGSTVNWSPSLADGTWFWRASGTDTVGGSSWSPTRSFILNTTVPNVPTLVSPGAGVTTNSLNLTATFTDPSVTDAGTVDFRLCTDSSCSAVVASGSSPSVTNGSNGAWTISPAPSDGTYYWEAANHDMAGNVSAWSAPRLVTFDRTPPTTTIGSNPGSVSTSSSATFGFFASETATFECNLDNAGWGTSCTSSTTYGGLADGNHSFQVRATDAVGNLGSAATWAWSIDTTVPSTPVLTAPADATLINTIPQLGATFTDPTAGDTGVTQFRICTSPAGAGLQCSPFVVSGTSSTVTSGSTAAWTPSTLADGTYYWQARAQDTAGNASGWSATRSFTYDSTAPDTTITAQPPSASSSTNASFSFSSTDSPPTLKCSLDGAAFAPCTSPLTYTALTEASHTFQVEAIDAAGNTDSTPASYTWIVDLTSPDTPPTDTTQPADGAWVASAHLRASFSDPGFGGTGMVEFRICPDALCLAVSASGSSAAANGGLAGWTPAQLGDGLYWWQARAKDAAGNQSGWSAGHSFHLDATPPAAPRNLNGQLGPDGLTLRWDPPNDVIANYVVYVDGAPWKNLGSTEFEVKMGPYDVGDTRAFSVVAVDLAGNVGAMSPVLVGVPDLLGLTWVQALAATAGRGLELRRSAASFTGASMLVSSQEPMVPALAERGSPVVVTMSPPRGGPPGIKVKPGRFVCAAGSVLRPNVLLSERAVVRTRLLNKRGRVVKRGTLGALRAGTTKVKLKLPRGLSRGNYRLMFDATAQSGRARALVRVKVGTRVCRSR
jgi:hypothetical protein